MKKEQVVISFIAVVIGIFVAGIAFYIYQSTRIIPPSKTKTISLISPTPTPATSIFLTLERPKDEDLVDRKTITVSGKTTSDATVVISTDASDQVVKPTTQGSFSADVTIGDATNKVEVTAIGPDGQEATQTRIITFSTENF